MHVLIGHWLQDSKVKGHGSVYLLMIHVFIFDECFPYISFCFLKTPFTFFAPSFFRAFSHLDNFSFHNTLTVTFLQENRPAARQNPLIQRALRHKRRGCGAFNWPWPKLDAFIHLSRSPGRPVWRILPLRRFPRSPRAQLRTETETLAANWPR